MPQDSRSIHSSQVICCSTQLVIEFDTWMLNGQKDAPSSESETENGEMRIH